MQATETAANAGSSAAASLLHTPQIRGLKLRGLQVKDGLSMSQSTTADVVVSGAALVPKNSSTMIDGSTPVMTAAGTRTYRVPSIRFSYPRRR